MKNKKIISEQSNPQTFDLVQSVKLKCFDTYKAWFDIDPGNQPKKTNSGKSVVTGKNKKGETIFFYDNGVVKNQITKVQKNWKCSQSDFANQNQTNDSTILTNFGLTKNDTEKVTQITTALQTEYINNGYVSDIFAKWNQMLKSNFPDVTLLTSKSNTEPFDLPMDKRKLTSGEYEPVNSDFFKTKYGWNNVSMYKLKASETDTNLANIKTTPENCKTSLVKYLGAAIAYEAQINTSQNKDILNSKVFIRRCFGNGNYDAFEGIDKGDLEKDYVQVGKSFTPFGGGFLARLSKMGKKLSFSNIQDLLSGKSKYLPVGNNPYIPFFVDKKDSQNESDRLSSIIKKNLIESSNNKKTLINEERKIIQNRVIVLLEKRELKSEDQLRKFANEILTEALYLNQQGFNRDLINEDFWDSLKGIFGGVGLTSVSQYFKEQVVKYLIGKIAPGTENGWIAGTIEKLLANTPITEIPQLLHCDYLIPKLTKSVVEEVVAKTAESKGFSGGIYDILRNGMVEMLDNTSFAQSIEKGLRSMVCPSLGGVANKLEDAANTMRKKALS
jgi:hypothetical protein